MVSILRYKSCTAGCIPCYSHLSSFCNLITLIEKMQGCNRMTFMSDDPCKMPCRIRRSKQCLLFFFLFSFHFKQIIMLDCWTSQCTLLSFLTFKGEYIRSIASCFSLCFAYCSCSDFSCIWFNRPTVTGEKVYGA